MRRKMTIDQAKARGPNSRRGIALAKVYDNAKADLLYSNEQQAKSNLKTLTWCGIAMGAAIAIPAIIYFAPHFF